MIRLGGGQQIKTQPMSTHFLDGLNPTRPALDPYKLQVGCGLPEAGLCNGQFRFFQHWWQMGRIWYEVCGLMLNPPHLTR